MTIMDRNAISWVGDIYQKFETLCVEAEENMYKGTVKFVEEQVRTVGEGVKKLYSEVMEDLQKDCMDKGMTPPREVTNTKPPREVTNTKEDVQKISGCVTRVPSSGNMSLDLDGDLDGVKKLQSDVMEDLPRDCMDKGMTPPREVTNTKEDIPEISGCVTRVPSCGNMSLDLDGDLDVSSANADMESTMTSDTLNCEDVDDFSDTLHVDTFADFFNRLDVDPETSTQEQAQEQANLSSKLGESCVLVEKYEHAFTLTRQQDQKSYKKKIRDVFSTRKWSKGRRDPKQSPICYEEQNADCLVSSSSMHARIKDLELYESSDSEWEIV